MDGIVPKLHERLRRPPVAATVPGSLPVLFFGDLPQARVATIGLNPTREECLSPKGSELDGPKRRFETLRSHDAPDRASLTATGSLVQLTGRRIAAACTCRVRVDTTVAPLRAAQ